MSREFLHVPRTGPFRRTGFRAVAMLPHDMVMASWCIIEDLRARDLHCLGWVIERINVDEKPAFPLLEREMPVDVFFHGRPLFADIAADG